MDREVGLRTVSLVLGSEEVVATVVVTAVEGLVSDWV